MGETEHEKEIKIEKTIQYQMVKGKCQMSSFHVYIISMCSHKIHRNGIYVGECCRGGDKTSKFSL